MAKKDTSISTLFPKMRSTCIVLFLLLSLWLVLGTSAFRMRNPIPSRNARPWEQVAADKRNGNLAKIPHEWRLKPEVIEEGKKQRSIAGSFIESLLDPDTRHITDLDPVEIIKATTSGKLSSLAVTNAFCKRAAFAHQLNTNLLEINFDAALARARELDEFFSAHGMPVGPLHGLPVSLKDQFHIKGLETSMGYIGWIGKERPVESELIRQLVELGAIPIAKTSNMQTLWFGETNNNICGYNWNPHVQTLSSGGSSGGEAAFQALRGSAIGFGTDIGGSVSIPSSFNGLYSIKPSYGRISTKNMANSSPGQIVIQTVVGIMGPSIGALRLMFQSLMASQPWLHDPDVLPLPWRKELEYDTEKSEAEPLILSFGLMETDGVVSPHPPIQRALRTAAEALRSAGHEIMPWQPPSHQESSHIHPAFTNADGGADVVEQIRLSGEPLVPQLHKYFADAPFPPLPLLDFYNLSLHLKDFRNRYSEYWLSTMNHTNTGRPVDAVILPVAPHAAVIPGKYYYYTYSSIMNVLDYTTVVIPVTTASAKVDLFDKGYKPVNEKDKMNWEAYDPEAYDGAPAAIQLMGRRLDEERLLSIAQILVKSLEDYRTKKLVA